MIFKKISRRLGLLRRHLKDPCPPAEGWNQNDNFDLLIDDWFGDIMFLNPPFSKTAATLVRCF